MSAGAIVAWLGLAWIAVQIKNGLASESGKKLLDAVSERLRNNKRED